MALRDILQLLATADTVPISLILSILMIEAVYSTEAWVLAKATRRHISDYGILHRHCYDNLKTYITVTTIYFIITFAARLNFHFLLY
jgi:hypothetical protein